MLKHIMLCAARRNTSCSRNDISDIHVMFVDGNKVDNVRVHWAAANSLNIETRATRAFLNRELEHRLRSYVTSRCQILNCYVAFVDDYRSILLYILPSTCFWW